MLKASLQVLDLITSHGYEAYLVGGYVRDFLLGIKSNDVDICTNATPKELVKIFKGAKIPREDYGAVIVTFHDIRFEITTYRREIQYMNNRKPTEICYINSLEEDLLRRDFTINTICMDKNENIIDLLDGRKDIDNKIIRVVGDSNKKFSDDSLRILRAVRFATKLNFKLDDEVVIAIKKNKKYLKNISYERKREELDKIFTCSNNKVGIKLLVELGLSSVLEIPDIEHVTYTDSLMGIWAIIDKGVYRFTSNEKEIMRRIRKVLEVDNFDSLTLYSYGLYASSVAASIKGYSQEDITKRYNELPIHKRSDICIKGSEIAGILERKEGAYLNEIYDDLERKILDGVLVNERDHLLTYCVDNYKEV